MGQALNRKILSHQSMPASTAYSGFESLPTDIFGAIVSRLDYIDIIQLFTVCKSFRKESSNFTHTAIYFSDDLGPPYGLSDICNSYRELKYRHLVPYLSPVRPAQLSKCSRIERIYTLILKYFEQIPSWINLSEVRFLIIQSNFYQDMLSSFEFDAELSSLLGIDSVDIQCSRFLNSYELPNLQMLDLDHIPASVELLKIISEKFKLRRLNLMSCSWNCDIVDLKNFSCLKMLEIASKDSTSFILPVGLKYCTLHFSGKGRRYVSDKDDCFDATDCNALKYL
jgi:hypothetical protein